MFKITKKINERFKKSVPKFQKVLDIAKDRDVNESDTVAILNDIFSKPSNFRLSEQEHADWVRWMALRDQVLAKLEDARREKVIGKSLEAKVTIQLPFDEVNRLKNNHTVIREILNVSQLEWIEELLK